MSHQPPSGSSTPSAGPPDRPPSSPSSQQPLWLGHRAPQEPSGPPWGPGAAGGTPEEKRRIWPFLLLGLLALLGLSAGVVVAFSTDGGDDAPTPVAELRVGDCLVSTDLARGLPSVGGIEVVGCAEEHDAEVFATFELADEDIADFDVDTIGARCVDGLVDAGSSLARLQQEDIEVRPLVGTEQPEVGDPVVCFLRHTDGQRLSGSIIQ